MKMDEKQPKVPTKGSNSVLLLTGTEGDRSAEKYTEAFEKVGYVAQNIPPYDFHPTYTKELLEPLICAEVMLCSGIIVTSKRAATLLGDAVTSPMNDHKYKHLPVYTVGPATGQILESLGFEYIIGTDFGSATALAEIIEQEKKMGLIDTSRPLIFLCGDKRRNDIPNMLKRLKIKHEIVEVYRTVRNPSLTDALRKATASKPANWVVFFSPSGVDFCTDHLINFIENGTKFAAIGPTTANKLAELGLDVSAVAATPTPAGLVQAIEAADLQDR